MGLSQKFAAMNETEVNTAVGVVFEELMSAAYCTCEAGVFRVHLAVAVSGIEEAYLQPHAAFLFLSSTADIIRSDTRPERLPLPH